MLEGVRILLVEEEFLVALDMQDILREAGVAEVETCRTTVEAMRLSERLGEYHLAIIEAQLGSPTAVEFARRLRAAGVAVVVSSADRTLSHLFPHAGMLEKPFDAAALLLACRAARESVS